MGYQSAISTLTVALNLNNVAFFTRLKDLFFQWCHFIVSGIICIQVYVSFLVHVRTVTLLLEVSITFEAHFDYFKVYCVHFYFFPPRVEHEDGAMGDPVIT